MARKTIFLNEDAIGNIVYFEALRAVEANTKKERMKHISAVMRFLKAIGYNIKTVSAIGTGIQVNNQEKGIFFEVDIDEGQG